MDARTYRLLEQVYRLACSLVVVLAEALGKPNPIIPRDERRARRYDGAGVIDG